MKLHSQRQVASSGFARWPILNRFLSQGLLQVIDLMFAESVLNKCDSDREGHAALLSVLFALSRQGHLCLDLTACSLALRHLGIEDLEELSTLVQEGASTFVFGTWVYRLGSCCYLQKNWMYESSILLHLERLSKTPPTIAISSWTTLPSPTAVSRLNLAQAQAVKNGIDNALSFLTGGPGTGKTFTAAEIVKTCMSALTEEERGQFRIILTAPTGKAVARLEEGLKKNLHLGLKMRTGTLHAILGIKAQDEKEEVVPLFADLIIVDECSMIDARIFSRLLASVRSGTRLILIGDKDQLPPVEAGSIFADLLDIYPSVKLMTSLRSDRKEILYLSDLVKEGRVDAVMEFLLGNQEIILERELQNSRYLQNRPFEPFCNPAVSSTLSSMPSTAGHGPLLRPLQTDSKSSILQEPGVLQFPLETAVSRIVWTDLEEGKKTALQLCANLWENYKDRFPSHSVEKPLLSKLEGFGLLSCMRQGSLGVDAINRYFLYESLKEAPSGTWWAAPIMITRNDYELDLYNGDLGLLIRKVTPDFSLRQFHIDDYAVFYERTGGFRQIAALSLTSFEYSYCLSVHKSQGSEYEEVLILMPQGSEHFGREVLYTAITRAKNKVALAGSEESLRRAIALSSRKLSGLQLRVNAAI